MIPLRDNIPTRRFAYMTYVLIAVNMAVFFYELGLGSGIDSFITRWGYVPERFTATIGAGHLDLMVLATLVTSTFLHGGWVHILGNMLYLHIFGNNVEDSMGHARFLIFYLLIGALANFGQIFLSPHSTIPGIGASGAIAGVLGAYLLLFPRARVLVFVPIFFFFLPFFMLPATVVLVIWFGMQVFEGAASILAGQTSAGGVAFAVHVVGFILGMVMIFLFRKREHTEGKPTWI